MTDNLTRSILRVGDGRGFVVNHRKYMGYDEPVVITAAHCLPFLPPPHPAMYLSERTYRALLGPLGAEPAVWAECMFADPVADIAVLGSPDSQDLHEQAEAYERLLEEAEPLVIADAPAQGTELLKIGDGVEVPTPGEGPVRVLSLDGNWLDGHVERRSFWLSFKPEKLIVGGMSGSPILSANGAAIGVVSVDNMCPVIVDTLPGRITRGILAAGGRDDRP
jgi:hypothetical protein